MEDEVQKYLNYCIVGGMIVIGLAIVLNIVAALVSHIALWQVLEWLAATSVIIGFLSFTLYWWIRENNVS